MQIYERKNQQIVKREVMGQSGAAINNREWPNGGGETSPREKMCEGGKKA